MAIDEVIDLDMDNDVSVGHSPIDNMISKLDQDLLKKIIIGKINAALVTMSLDPEVLTKDRLFPCTLDDLDDKFTSNVSGDTDD